MSHDQLQSPHADGIKSPVGSLAAQLAVLQQTDRGAFAKLRRFHPIDDPRASMFETERLLLRGGIEAQGETRMRWALALHCLALAQGRHAAGPDHPKTGKVLHELGLSEARLKQLLEADAGSLFDLMPQLARRIGAAGKTLDWRPLVELLMHAGTASEDRADSARRRIVQAYLQAETQDDADQA